MRTIALACAALMGLSGGAVAADEATIAAANKEGGLVIYSATDYAQVQPMIEAFRAKYPNIKVDYNDLNTNIIYNRVISEAAANQVGGDVVWNSAMDLQMRLAKDGYLQSYESSERANLPGWAVSDDHKLYAITVEPVGAIYNKLAVGAADAPNTRAKLIALMSRPDAKGRIATFDPEKSGIAFLIQTNDAKETTTFKGLVAAFRAAGGKSYSSSGSMRETVASGENILAFNLIGSYAMEWAKDSQTIGVVFGEDYTPAFSRLAGILDKAPHPNAAKVFMDFALGQEGQAALAGKGLPSVRNDVATGLNIDTLNTRVGGNLKPIPVDAALLDYTNPMKRVQFLRGWAAGKN
ncbi:ABC transporter substrate-binding protein [Xanthobacter sp. AM11]|uniref:ABC transporter substrate-binding protein n=1 Tax=Xanthobacter sp. AM11 TaxID=3380643 RepID=UPI0039BFFEEF